MRDDDKVNILLVDDRPGNLLSLNGILDHADYNLIKAQSGPEALRLVLRHELAVILLDVAMPGMDGFEVATLIKQRERFRSIPIIFVTASVQDIEWIFRAYSVGAVDFLQKPLDPHAVRAKVAVFVELFRQRQQVRRQAARLQEVERRERELEVANVKMESERRYRHLAEAIPHVVWTAGAGGDMEYFNQRWSIVTGLTDEQSRGAGWRAALHPAERDEFVVHWTQGIQSGQPFDIECRLRDAAGQHRWFLCRALPELAPNGLAGWLGTLTDVDEQKRADEESQAAIRLRDEFLSVASHELRTPLSALQLQLESLHGLARKTHFDRVDARVPGKLASAVRQTERLSKLVDGLLDVSRITSGRLELEVEDFDMADAVRDVVERFREEAARAGCELTLNLQHAEGRWDRLRIEQVITNLLSNAIKYSRGQPVAVAVEPDGENAIVSVRDQGIGIDPAHLRRIFERFERAVPSRHYGGLGLGLYIVRQIVEAHGGRVDAQSDPGQGAIFRIELPRDPLERAEAARRAQSTEHEGQYAG